MPITRSQSIRGGASSSNSGEEIEQPLWFEVEVEVESEQIASSSDTSSFTSDTSEEQELTMVVTQRARFQYKTFHGKPKEDPDAWLEDFIGTAQANGEFDIRLTTLAGVLRGEARPWFNNLADATKNDWGAFKQAFLHEFRKVGEESEALIKMGEIRMGSKESVRRFLQRFQRLVTKLDPRPADSMLLAWFVASLPKKMGVSVRQSHPTTLEEAIEAAQSYRSAEISSSKSRKKKKRYTHSDSSSSSSESSSSDEDTSDSESEESSSSSSSDSDSDGDSKKKKKKKSKRKEDKKKQASKKKSSSKHHKSATFNLVGGSTLASKEKKVMDNKMNEITNQLKALSVHFAGVQPDRRKVPVNRAHVWCVKCKKFGHTPQECPGWMNQVQYVNEEANEVYQASEVVDYFYEEAPEMVYQISSGPRNLQGRPASTVAPQLMPGLHPRMVDQMGPQGASGGARTSVVICWNCHKPGHYSNTCPEPRKQGQGAPYLLCVVCKREGHTSTNCPVGAAARMVGGRAEGPQQTTAQGPGETIVNFVSMEWQEKAKDKKKQTADWEFQEDLPGMETPEDEAACYKVSTRATRKKDRVGEKKKKKEEKKKEEKKSFEPEVETQVEVPPEEDSDYDRYHPKLYYPKVTEEVKKQLEEMETKEQQEALNKDLKVAQALKENAAVEEKKETSQVTSYDIKKDVKECMVTATVGQLIKDNPLYRRQLKEMLVGRRRRRKLPKVGTQDDVMMVCEDYGAPEIDIQISGCVLSYVPIDGGSGVNIMIEATAQQLGFKKLQPTARTMRLANGARVLPVGTLTQVPTLIGGQEFLLNYLVMRPERPSTYPILIGRPWLYGAQVVTDWGKKEFRFGAPTTSVSWGHDKHQGETTHELEEYDSEFSDELTSELDSDEDEVYMLNLLSQISEEEVFGDLQDQHNSAKAPMLSDDQVETTQAEVLGKNTQQGDIIEDPQDDKMVDEEKTKKHVTFADPISQDMEHKPELKSKKESSNDPMNGGLRLAHLEETFDPTMRNKTEVVRAETFRKISVSDGKPFYIGYALESVEEKSLQDLLVEYGDVFAWKHSDITGIPRELGEHRIDLMLGARPVRQRQYRLNPKYSLMVKEEIDRLLEADFIYPVLTSEWVSSLVIVPKKLGVDKKPKIRVCQDFRKLNEATLKDHYPIPFTDMVLDIVASREAYSFLDGYSGYNQIWIREEDQLKTAFTTEWGVFAFRRMPFGLCNAPGMFQRVMMNIFHDFLRNFLEVFIDDFAVYGAAKDHVQHLRKTFQRCRETDLKLHPGKCFFGVQEGILLGHKVSKKGIEVDQEKIAVWLAVAFPSSLVEVQGFLGCSGYYRRFIIHFAKVALPLTLMLRKDSDFEPTPERLAAFNELKKRLAEAPILVTPDWSKEFHVYVDVSGFCIGAVLSQLDEEGRDHPIYFASRQLAPAEKNYSPTDREALGIIYSCKKFRHYLLGYKVIFHTDHNALKYMVNKADVTGRVARWILLLQEFDYEVRIRPGKQHANADFFSRIEGKEDSKEVEDQFPDEDLFHVGRGEDTWYSDIIQFLLTTRLPRDLNQEEAAVFLRKVRPYLLVKGILHKEGVDGRLRRCLEKNEVSIVMRAMHEEEAGGHYAKETTTKKILAAGYWWPTLHKDVYFFVRGCDPCQRVGKPAHSRHHPLTPILPLAPFEKWGIDFIGPITPVTRSGRNRYIILATDYATKWVEARPTSKDNALTVARFMYEQIFTRFGPPLELVSDRGTHFLNEMIEELTNHYLIKHRKTTPYHPKANGLTERANGIIGKILNKTVAAHKTDWDNKLYSAVYSYNLAFKTTTGHSPYYLVFGQYSLVPVEFEVPTLRVSLEERMEADQSLMERAYQLEELEELREDASKQVRRKQAKIKKQHDKRLRKTTFLLAGQLVLLYDSRYAHFPGKLHTRWLGPYVVHQVFQNGSIQLETLEGEVFSTRVHHDRLKRYFNQE
jgi:transposase InsO family protein